MTRRRSVGRGLMASAALVAVSALAGCGSTVPANETSDQALGVPAVTIGGSAPSASVATTGGESPGGQVVAPPTSVSPTIGAGGAVGSRPSTASSATASAPGSASARRASSAPVQTGPITVGFLTTATSNAGNFGASIGNTVTDTAVDQALIDAINKRGGIAGRQLKIVFAHTDTGGSDWAAEFQAACATFTQDHHVDAVLGYEFDYVASFESCLAKLGIPHISDSYNVPAEISQYPLYWSLSTPPVAQIQLAKFTGAMNIGFLTPKDKLGVLLDDCPGNQAAWQNDVLPFLQAHHINVASTFSLSCGTGQNAGTVSSVAELTNVLLHFRSEGVNRISFQTAEGPVLLVGSVDAQAQGYRPGWIVSSLGGLAVVGANAPPAQMKNTHGFGWMPSQDVPPQYAPKPNAAQRRCLSLLHSQKVYPRAAQDFVYAYQACEAVFMYEKALELDGGNINGTAVSEAIASVGRNFQSMLNLGGQSVFSAARQNDAPLIYKPINYDGYCHCFRYGHQTYSMPSDG